MYVFFFFTFYIAFFVHPSHLSLYYICTVQRVHINYQNKCAQMSFFTVWLPFLDKLTMDDLKWGKYLDLFDLQSTIPVSDANGSMTNADAWGRPPPLPHHRAVRYLFSWFKRLSSRTLRLYKNTSFFHLKGKFGWGRFGTLSYRRRESELPTQQQQ